MKIHKIYLTKPLTKSISTKGAKQKEIGPDAAKQKAWWRHEYREAKAIEDAIKNDTFERELTPIYRETGEINLGFFHEKWNPYDENGFI